MNSELPINLCHFQIMSESRKCESCNMFAKNGQKLVLEWGKF